MTPMRKLFTFNENGDPPATYDLLNWQMDDNNKIQLHNVGFYESPPSQGKEFHITRNAIVWKGDKKVGNSSHT